MWSVREGHPSKGLRGWTKTSIVFKKLNGGKKKKEGRVHNHLQWGGRPPQGGTQLIKKTPDKPRAEKMSSEGVETLHKKEV